MKDFFFQKSLQRLEREGNNDYGLIIEFGADAYSTEELDTILEEVSEQQQVSALWQKKLFILGFSVSLLMAASILSGIMEAPVLSYIFLSTVPFVLILGLIGHLVMQSRYPYLGDRHLITSIIQQELEWRQKDKLIF